MSSAEGASALLTQVQRQADASKLLLRLQTGNNRSAQQVKVLQSVAHALEACSYMAGLHWHCSGALGEQAGHLASTDSSQAALTQSIAAAHSLLPVLHQVALALTARSCLRTGLVHKLSTCIDSLAGLSSTGSQLHNSLLLAGQMPVQLVLRSHLQLLSPEGSGVLSAGSMSLAVSATSNLLQPWMTRTAVWRAQNPQQACATRQDLEALMHAMSAFARLPRCPFLDNSRKFVIAKGAAPIHNAVLPVAAQGTDMAWTRCNHMHPACLVP